MSLPTSICFAYTVYFREISSHINRFENYFHWNNFLNPSTPYPYFGIHAATSCFRWRRLAPSPLKIIHIKSSFYEISSFDHVFSLNILTKMASFLYRWFHHLLYILFQPENNSNLLSSCYSLSLSDWILCDDIFVSGQRLSVLCHYVIFD
jgi:hypothetical protein